MTKRIIGHMKIIQLYHYVIKEIEIFFFIMLLYKLLYEQL
jgi:hypothetical protein